MGLLSKPMAQWTKVRERVQNVTVGRDKAVVKMNLQSLPFNAM